MTRGVGRGRKGAHRTLHDGFFGFSYILALVSMAECRVYSVGSMTKLRQSKMLGRHNRQTG